MIVLKMKLLFHVTCQPESPRKTSTITWTVNGWVFTKMLDTFLIPLIENRFGDDEVIFWDDNKFYHRTKKVKDFLQDRQSKPLI